jgi:hypothetical protein
MHYDAHSSIAVFILFVYRHVFSEKKTCSSEVRKIRNNLPLYVVPLFGILIRILADTNSVTAVLIALYSYSSPIALTRNFMSLLRLCISHGGVKSSVDSGKATLVSMTSQSE